MIVYSKSKKDFIIDYDSGEIADIVKNAVHNKLNKRVGESEFSSWNNSLTFMGSVVTDHDIPDDAGIAIEYNIPRTGNRIDFIISGLDENKKENLVLIELKQWSECQLTNEDAVVVTRLGGGRVRTAHPSYQAWSYASLLRGFNQVVYDQDISLNPCAYLHNYSRDGIIDNPFYKEHLQRAPVFCRADKSELRNFIKRFIRFGNKEDIILKIENGRIRPSKQLADTIVSMLKGNQEFTLIDSQKVVFERALRLAKDSRPTRKKVLIVEGGPGTGKSVIAINLLARLTEQGLFTQYVTKNSAPRTVYEAKLTGTFNKSEISNFFSSSGTFHQTKANYFDALIVDEAHRLNERSGMFNNRGENQVKEIINASKFSMFFIDEAQRVHIKDIGEIIEIKRWANFYNAEIELLDLTSQFRCGGSDGYLAWLDNKLEIRQTANTTLEDTDYDFRVFDNPNKLRQAIEERNRDSGTARMVAGYCWDWSTDPEVLDVRVDEFDFAMKWNLREDGMKWIMKPESINEIGCIHTCQGLELDYIGVIIGPDMFYENGKIRTNVLARSSQDRSIFGHKKMLREDAEEAKKVFDQIIRNTYRTLMTRGVKGCYIYCMNKDLNSYFRVYQ